VREANVAGPNGLGSMSSPSTRPAPQRRLMAARPASTLVALAPLPSLACHGRDLPIEAVVADELIWLRASRGSPSAPRKSSRYQTRRASSSVPRARSSRCGVVGAVAGPAVLCGVGHHAGTHAVELAIAPAEQQVGFGLDRRGPVTPLLRGGGAPVSWLMDSASRRPTEIGTAGTCSARSGARNR
jgi:hypothetical protein